MGFVRCSENEALIVTGCCHGKTKFIFDGFVLTWPTEILQKISLKSKTLKLESPRIKTKSGEVVTVVSTAEVKIAKHPQLLEAACEVFLGKSEDEIKKIAMELVDGSQRSIIGAMTLEQIKEDHYSKFSKAVFEMASSEMISFGLILVHVTVDDLLFPNGYPVTGASAEKISEKPEIPGDLSLKEISLQ